MPAKANLTKSAAIQTAAREVDFVTRFALNWQHLRDIVGIMRQIRKTPGTVLKSKYAEVTLQNGQIGEGEEIPYSEATVKTKDYLPINVEKFAKAVSIEAINEHGYDDAVNMTDQQFLFELQTNVTTRFYDFLKTGTLVSTKSTFQEALAEAQGRVRNKWKKMHRGITDVVGFCNILDAYDYLGAANITVQTQFGLNYIENFIGYSKLFLCSEDEIPRGKVIATPVENIILYYVSPDDSDFAKAGLQYRTDGETNLIGFHVQGNYGTAVSESFALMGMTLMAEYIDGIAVITMDANPLPGITLSPEAQGTSLYGVPVSNVQYDDVVVSNGKITGTLKYQASGTFAQDWGKGYFIALKFSNIDASATSLKVGLSPSAGTGRVEAINDPDKNGIFKITNKNQQSFKVVVSNSGHETVQYFDLSGLTLEEV